ncbi:hypothetical protein DESC_140055 [Desulfosarcina cetonica]|nr:hypothetical protein DESC_140055 [Desulfosarcina cetonica]
MLKYQSKRKRIILLYISIIVNLGTLGSFKYYNFFLENLVSCYTFFGSEMRRNRDRYFIQID